MSYEPETPFDSIEGAHEYLRLLAEAVEESRADISAELSTLPPGSRRADALRLVAYKLERLAEHSSSSRRILNDLRTLRRLLLSERQSLPSAVPERRAG
jgi:hypothetical protein